MKKLGDLHYKEEFSVFAEADANHPDPEVRKRFFGKYQATVVANIDPLRQGRLQVRVPGVADHSVANWAMPCVPMAGPFMGTQFVPPALGAGVWVEFEHGDSQHPIWVGCYWGPGQIPPLAQAAATTAPGLPVITMETNASGVSICDAPLPPGGNINLHVGAATFITLGVDGVTIVAPSVKITTGSFTINGAALSVI